MIDRSLGSLEKHLEEEPSASSSKEVEDLRKNLHTLLILTGKPLATKDSFLQNYYGPFHSRYLHPEVLCTRNDDTKSSSLSTSVSAPVVKKYNLPKIPIPEFHGDPLDWASLWEQFTTAVDSNTTLSEADKLTYLRAAIKGKEAIEIVSASTAKYNDYSTIVGLLKKRYEKRRLVHRLHVKALTQHQAKTNSYEEISKLHVTWKKHLAGLHDSGQYEVGAVLTSIAVSNLIHELTINGLY